MIDPTIQTILSNAKAHDRRIMAYINGATISGTIAYLNFPTNEMTLRSGPHSTTYVDLSALDAVEIYEQ